MLFSLTMRAQRRVPGTDPAVAVRSGADARESREQHGEGRLGPRQRPAVPGARARGAFAAAGPALS